MGEVMKAQGKPTSSQTDTIFKMYFISSSEAVKIVCQEKEDISEDKSGQKSSLLEFFQISNLHPLVLTCCIHFLQAWSGVNVIIFKTVSVFEVVGSSIDKYVCTAVVGGVQLFATGCK